MRLFDTLALSKTAIRCLFFLAFFFNISVWATDFRSMIFDISKIALKSEISITSISNDEGFIKIKGPAYQRNVIQEFSKKLLFARDMAVYQLSDAVSFFGKNEFMIVLRPHEDTFFGRVKYVTFISPSPRKQISKDSIVKGRCSREGAEVVIGGDTQGMALCVKGSWEFKVPMIPSNNTDLIHLSASQRMMNQEIIRDYRAFRKP